MADRFVVPPIFSKLTASTMVMARRILVSRSFVGSSHHFLFARREYVQKIRATDISNGHEERYGNGFGVVGILAISLHQWVPTIVSKVLDSSSGRERYESVESEGLCPMTIRANKSM